MPATKISNNVKTINKGIKIIDETGKATIKLAKILSIIWPAIILMHKRKHKLMGLAKKEIISIGIINKVIGKGILLCMNILKNFRPDVRTPMIITLKKVIKANVKVMINWLVNVKKPGIKPSKLPINIIKNIVIIKGI